MIKLRTDYKIKGNSSYFKKKYGTPNPIIWVEDLDTALFGEGGWGMAQGNPAAILYAMRTSILGDNTPMDGNVYYGKINLGDGNGSLGELVHETELEEIV